MVTEHEKGIFLGLYHEVKTKGYELTKGEQLWVLEKLREEIGAGKTLND